MVGWKKLFSHSSAAKLSCFCLLLYIWVSCCRPASELFLLFLWISLLREEGHIPLLCFPSFCIASHRSSPLFLPPSVFLSEDGWVGNSHVSHFKGCSAAKWIPPSSLLPPLVSTLHPNRPPLYFPTAVCEIRPSRASSSTCGAQLFLPLFLLLSALHCKSVLNKKKLLCFCVILFTVLFLVCFNKTRRILRKWRSRFQGVLTEISIQLSVLFAQREFSLRLTKPERRLSAAVTSGCEAAAVLIWPRLHDYILDKNGKVHFLVCQTSSNRFEDDQMLCVPGLQLVV